MSTVEMKRLVEEATAEEQQFLFVCLSEKLYPKSHEQLEDLDRRLNELEAGEKRLSLEEFEKRLDQSNRG
jgi:hypothetical protein